MGFAAHQGLRRAEDTCPGGEAEAVVQKTRVQGRRGGRWCRKHMFTGEGGEVVVQGVKAAVGPTALTKEQAIALAQAEPSEREALSSAMPFHPLVPPQSLCLPGSPLSFLLFKGFWCRMTWRGDAARCEGSGIG